MLSRVNLIWHFGELFYYCTINYAYTMAYLVWHLVTCPIWFIFGCIYVTTCMVSWRLKSGVYLGPNIRPAGLFIAAADHSLKITVNRLGTCFFFKSISVLHAVLAKSSQHIRRQLLFCGLRTIRGTRPDAPPLVFDVSVREVCPSLLSSVSDILFFKCLFTSLAAKQAEWYNENIRVDHKFINVY